MAALGAKAPASGSAACSRSPSRTRRPASSRSPATRSASSRCCTCAAATGIVFASELKALLAAVGPELRIEPGAMVASMLYYWVPEQQCSIQGVRKLPGGQLGALPARRHARGARLLARAGCRPGGGPGPGRRPQDRHRGERHRAPDRRRAGVELPVRRPGLQHHHRARPPAGRQRRRLHDHLPAGGPEAGGDAGRRDLRAQGRPAVRHRPARDRDLPGHRRHAARRWSTSSTSRSATRRRSTPS